MRHLKTLAATAAATALLTVIGASVAQDNSNDPMATPPQNVDITAPNASGQQIYFFRDQGNSPESDPAAHLLLIKHDQPAVPVAMTTTTTTVAQATTQDDTATAMPAPAATSNTETTDTAAPAPVDNAEPALAPKADRN